MNLGDETRQRQKNLTMTPCRQICDAIVSFPIYDYFAAGFRTHGLYNLHFQ